MRFFRIGKFIETGSTLAVAWEWRGGDGKGGVTAGGHRVSFLDDDIVTVVAQFFFFFFFFLPCFEACRILVP